MKNVTASVTLILLTVVLASGVLAQSAGDWRSAATGNWNAAATWERYNGSAWVTPTTTPTDTSGAITIRSPHVVTISATVSYDQVTVDAGGQVTVASTITSTLANGAGTDLTVNGTWLNSGGTWTATGTWAVGSGGTFIHNTASGISTPLNNSTLDSLSTFIYRGSSTLNTSVAISGKTYGTLKFESTSGTWTPAAASGSSAFTVKGSYDVGGSGAGTVTLNQSGASSALTISGSLTIRSSCTFQPPTGTLTISGDITNSGTFTTNASSSVVFNGSTTLSGSGLVSFANGFTVNAGKTFANSQNNGIVASGKTATINGTFQINQGSWTGSTGTYSYGASGSLIFNNSSGSYGSIDNSHLYWPSSNGPANVNVQGAGGITLGVARTVSGTFQTSAGVTNANNLTLNGTAQLNPGGYVTGSPTYGSSSTLVYNTGGTYGRGAEWNATSGAGYPANLQISNNTMVDVGANSGTGTARQISGNLTIDAGSTLSLNNTPMTAAVTVLGNVTLNGTLTLSTSSGGDFAVKGNFTRNSGSTLTNNSRSITFNGSSAQSIGGTVSSISFDYLTINNSAGVSISIPSFVNNTLNLSAGTFSVGANKLTINSGGAISQSGTGALSSTDTVAFPGTGTISGTVSMKHVTLAGGVNFGSASTVTGTLVINNNGYCNTNGPSYSGASALLLYNSGGTFGRTAEWQNAPVNVQLSNNTTLNYPNGVSITKSISGNLTIDAGSSFYMDYGSPNPGVGTLTVAGNVVLNGSLSLANLAGGDLKVGGNWTRTGVLTPNGRSVEFNGSSAQSLTGQTTFDYLTINNSAGVTLNSNALVNTALTFTAGKITTGSNSVILGSSAGISGAGSGKYIYGKMGYTTAASGSATVNFAVGDASNYTPVSVSLNGLSASGTITANTASGAHPQLASATSINQSKYVGRYWTVSNAGSAFTDYSATYNFVGGDLVGSPTTSNFIVGKYNGSSWSYPTVGTKTSTSTQATGLTSFSDFAIGEEQTYTITATAEANGSITPSGSVSVNASANQSFTISANTGYQVDSVVVDGSNQGSTASYTFTNVVANHTIHAYFSTLTYTISASSDANGSVTPSGNTSVAYDGSQAYSITPNTGCHIDSVIVDGSYVGTGATYTFNNVTANHTIRGVFAINTYTITASSGSNGSVTPSGATTVNYNGSQAYTITANTGYHIDSVFVDGSYAGNSGSYNFTSVTANHTISATFAINTYTISASGGANGSISPNGSTSVNYDGSQAYTITPDGGYHIDSIFVDGSYAGNTSPYTFSNVTTNHTISVTFAGDAFTVTASAGAHGSISPSGAVGISAGGNQSFTITPDAGYHIDSVVVDDVYAGNTSPYAFTSVSANHTITATFAINSYTITGSAGANGSISPNGATSVNYGGSQSYTITPDADYHIDSVLVDGSYVGNTSPYNITSVAANHTISASFAHDSVTVTASAGSNGSVSPSGSVKVSYNGSRAFTFTPNTGYHLDSVFVDGSFVGSSSPYTLSNVTAGHSVSATFAINSYSISSSAGANGAISPSGSTSVNYGGSQSYTITPDAHYHIDSVFVDGAYAGNSSPYNFTSVAANRTISASFAIDTYTLTASAPVNGSISPSGSVSVAWNGSQEYTFTGNSGYHLDSVFVDGSLVGNTSPYSVSNVSANHTVSATFAINTYAITVTAGAHGSVSPAGPTVNVNHGANQAFTISANSGYHIGSVTVDGNSQGAVASYTFTNVTATHTIAATFVSDTTAAGVLINGTIASGEYGSDTDGQNQQSNSGVVWHATWDSVGLYIGISGATTSEAAVIYLDKNPQTPINGGGNSDGTNIGQNYDGVNFSSMPFRADLVTYVKNGYREYRTANGSNGWSSATSGYGSYADNGSNSREVAIPWSAIGGEPSSFAFYGFLTSSGGFVYGQVPVENASGTIGTTGHYGRYYIVNSTNGSVKPFSRNSYVFNSTTDITGFGTISVYDFTMNSSGSTITRSSGGGNTWTIAGNLLVNAGTVDFGSATTSASVTGDVTVANGATLTLSTAVGGDLHVAGTFSKGASGTFNHNSRSVEFNGSSAQTIDGAVKFGYLTVNNAAGVTANAADTVVNALTFTSGKLSTGSNTILMLSGSGVSGAGTGKYVYGNIAYGFPGSGSSNFTYPVGDESNYTPVALAVNGLSAAGSVTVNTTAGAHPSIASAPGLNSAKAVGRYWTMTNSGTGFSNYSATFNFVPADLTGGADTAKLAVGKYTTGMWSYPAVGTRTSTSTQATGLTSFSDFAIAEQVAYTITASAGANGSISPSGATSVNYGASQSFTVTPNSGYGIDSIFVDGVYAGNNSPYSFLGVISDHTITATFKQVTYTITASAGANGSISPSGAVSVGSGANQQFTITPDGGYHIDSIVVDGSYAGASSPYTFTNVTANHTIAATFALNAYVITASAGSHGSITPSGTVNANSGSNKQFSIAANTGYHIDSVIVDGAKVDSTVSYTFTNIIADHTIRAVFAVDSMSITASAGTNGSISPSGTVKSAYGSNASFTFTPDAHYHVDSVLVDGAYAGSGSGYTFTNVVANHTISVTFAIDTYTITATAGSNGSVSPSGPTTVAYGGSQSITVTANGGYHIDSIYVDGAYTGTTSPVSFTNVSANHTMYAVFRIDAGAATIDGTIAAGEYGSDVNGQNQETSGGTVWHMTWDSTALYVGISGANTAEGAVLYLDKNPQTPINGGSNAEGTIVGQNYDGTNFSSMQFRADLVTYFKNGYREYRTSNGSNGWSGATSGYGSYADNGSSTREVSIPWSAIGGKPSSFAFFAYVTSSGGFVYGQVPAENTSGAIGTAAHFGRYYIVSTTDGSVKPYSRNSYVFNNTADLTGFGPITVYDFTMNSSGRSITRAAGAGGAWTIHGNFFANQGTIDFGSSTTPVNVDGDVTIYGDATVSLSTAAGGDLNLKGNLELVGLLNTNSRAVGFNGTSGQSANGLAAADYLSLNNAAGLTVTGDLTVNNTLTLMNGALNTGSNTVTIASGGSVSRSNGYVHGKLAKNVAAGSAVSKTFELGDAGAYAPATVIFNTVSSPGVIIASTTQGTHPNLGTSDITVSKKVNRYWTVTNNGTMFDSYGATFSFGAGDLDAGADTAKFAVRKYDAPDWSAPTPGAKTATSVQALGMTSFSDFAIGEVPSFTITATAGSNGSISPSGAVSVVTGGSQSFTVTPNSGYHVDSVIVDGGFVGTGSTYNFTAVSADHTIRAVFALTPIVPHTITATAGSGGSISPSGAVVVQFGADTTFAISPSTGYHLDSLIVDGVKIANAASYTFANVTTDHTIRVTFALNTFTITTVAGANGSITPGGPVTVNYGANQTFVFHPLPGFVVDSVIVDGAPVAAADSFTFTSVTANHSIRVKFRAVLYSIAATAGSNGAIAPSGSVSAPAGSDRVFLFTPDGGYRVDSVIVDGVRVDSVTGYTFFNVQMNHTIRVTFILNTYTITASAGTGGSITPSGSIGASAGSNRSFTFAPSTGYHVDSVIVDGVKIDSTTGYTFVSIAANHIIRVTFAINTYTITATAGVNGSISPSGAVTLAFGASQTFTITPASGYVVDSVVVDNANIGAPSSYFFPNVTANHTITAAFKLSPAYLAKYRTFTYDSLVEKKEVKKKNVTEYWEFGVVNSTAGALNEVHILFKNDASSILSANHGFAAAGAKKTWAFTAGTLAAGETLLVSGRSPKAKAQQIAKLWLGPVDKSPDAKGLSAIRNIGELPMPNAATIRNTAFVLGGFSKAAPLTIGVAKVDSPFAYGWVNLAKAGDMLKTLEDKTGRHTQIGDGFDLLSGKTFKKPQTSLPPAKHNDKTFADLLTLKFNIVLSQLGVTTRGLAELRYTVPASPFDGMLLGEIAGRADSMLTLHGGYTHAQFASLDSALVAINGAFSGPIDTTSWGDSLRLKPVAQLSDVPFLRASGLAASRIEPAADENEMLAAAEPQAMSLEQNYPNPFNPTTTIRFVLPADGAVTLAVYNLLGQEVSVLANNEAMDAGEQEFTFDASNLASGVYFYRISVATEDPETGASRVLTAVRKMMLLR